MDFNNTEHISVFFKILMNEKNTYTIVIIFGYYNSINCFDLNYETLISFMAFNI